MKYLNLIVIFLLGVYEAELQPPSKKTDVPDEKENEVIEENTEEIPIEESEYKNKPYPLINDIIRDPSKPKTAYAKRAIIKDRSFLWPNAIVPYKIDWTWLKHEKVILAKAIEFFNAVTCMKWVPWTNEPDYVFFDEAMNCSSDLGRRGGKQKLFLHPETCLKQNIILHEMMHAIGFDHEHVRPDRDQYVDIIWDNIDEDDYDSFVINSDIVTLGSYDYNSITHYSPYASTINGKRTIRPHHWFGHFGPIGSLSQLDIEKISLLYQCKQPAPK